MKELTPYVPALVCIIGALLYLFLPDSPTHSARLRWLCGVMFGVGLFWWIAVK